MYSGEDPSEEKTFSVDLGTLSFEEWMEAIAQFQSMGMTHNEDKIARLYAMWAFNDKYYRDDCDGQSPTDEELKIHKDNVKKLISMFGPGDSALALAEFHREIGDFDMAKRILKLYNERTTHWQEDELSYAQEILWRCEDEDTRVFTVYTDQQATQTA